MRTAAICPTCATYTNAACIVYDGPILSTINVDPLSTLDEILQNINTAVLQVSNASEKIANKAVNIPSNSASDVKYPSVKAVFTWGNSTFQPILGFVPENVTNKVANKTTFVSQGGSSVAYPSVKAVKDYIDDEITAIPVPTLQQVLTSGNSLSGARNFQGTNAGVGSTGVEIVAFGTAAGFGNTGSYVIGFGLDAVGGNTGDDVTAFGTGAAQGNTLNGVTVFSNMTLPTYADHAAAVLAITVPLGATPGCTYLYHNQATNSIGAVRL